MEQMPSDQRTLANRQPEDLAKLICKLRWIGMEEEARRLQTVLTSRSPDERSTVSAGPFSTD